MRNTHTTALPQADPPLGTSWWPWWILFLIAQVPVALAVYQMPAVATVHSLATLLLGFWWANSAAHLDRVAYVAAYIAGAEVLWRMSGVPIVYEFGKYSIVAIVLVAMFRTSRLRSPMLPSMYFLLLLPSVALTLINERFAVGRMQVSFNLAGPLALACSAWLFSYLELSAARVQRLFLSLIAPVIGVATVTVFAILTNPDIRFTGESNVETSGGFGPNQVASTLGLGALLALFCVLEDRWSRMFRGIMFGALVLMLSQSAMTFSRGGLYNAAGAAILACAFLLKERRVRLKFLGVAALLFGLATYVILPRFDEFTGGTLSARFQDTNTTNRAEIFQIDLEIWKEHFWLGVGPGQGDRYRRAEFQGGRDATAHTEFSRLLAEHGLFGASALILLFVMAFKNVKAARTPRSRAIVVATVAWSMLYMTNAAMRLAAPAFMVGLTFATFVSAEASVPALTRRRTYRGSVLPSALSPGRVLVDPTAARL
jgi:O-antigen ligase